MYIFRSVTVYLEIPVPSQVPYALPFRVAMLIFQLCCSEVWHLPVDGFDDRDVVVSVKVNKLISVLQLVCEIWTLGCAMRVAVIKHNDLEVFFWLLCVIESDSALLDVGFRAEKLL